MALILELWKKMNPVQIQCALFTLEIVSSFFPMRDFQFILRVVGRGG
jgi:hypothetical protein